MSNRVFLAGASGVIGRRLLPLLRRRGLDVVGTTRSPERAREIERLGARAVIVDVYDRDALIAAVRDAAPAVVIHQLTDLSHGFSPDRIAETLARNARLRTEATPNLVLAAQTAGARRLIAQSIAWVYQPGPEPHGEDDALDPNVHGVAALERAVLGAANAAVLAIDHGAPGAYNVAEPGPHLSIAKATRELGWDPGFRQRP